MHIEDLEISLISGGMIRMDAGGVFGLVPRTLYQRYLTPDSDNTLPMMLTCMVVRSRGKTILIDTGFGDKLSQRDAEQWRFKRTEGGLLGGLAEHQLSPQDIDIVINTHLHADHCGGNTRWEGDAAVATFPSAEYWVQRIEWAEASHPDARTRGTYFTMNFSPLMEEGRVRVLHGDTEVTDQVHCVLTPGHTRGHQSVLLQAGKWKGLYLGDVASYGAHFAHTSWLTAYDVLPLENITTKQRWHRWALENDAWLFFDHDPTMPVARLVERDGRLEVETIEGAQPLIDSLPKQLQLHE
jgi:glyoxylase-like metal-dependent hydrolase (beta-lactamase superfamily II)